MKTIAGLLVRVIVIAICGFATWKSVQLARADLSWAPGTTAGLHKAMEILPLDADYAARGALRKIDDVEDSPDVDAGLLRASRMNPLNAELLMTLGLRAEFRGDTAHAEQFLLQATQVDHLYKPAWTLASFCYRTGRLNNFWPMAKRCLNLDPFGFDPTAIFDLCWKVTSDAKSIQDLVPVTGEKPARYLLYLIGTKRTDAALTFWPVARDAIDPSVRLDLEAAMTFIDHLLATGRVPEAVQIWNQLVDRSIVRSGRLDPANGVSVADPEFSFARNAGAFSWHVAEGEGVFPAADFSSLRLELDGNEPQSLRLLSAEVPILAGRNLRLAWKSDGARLNLPSDPGFVFRVLNRSGTLLTDCQPMLAGGGAGTCKFSSAADTTNVRIELQYARAPGTIRASGVVQIASVRVEPAP